MHAYKLCICISTYVQLFYLIVCMNTHVCIQMFVFIYKGLLSSIT